MILINALRKRAEKVKEFWEDRTRRHKVALTLIFILIYGVLLEPLGFLLTTFLTVGLLVKFIYPQKWKTVIACALLTSLGSYLIFQVLLEAELPRGFMGF